MTTALIIVSVVLIALISLVLWTLHRKQDAGQGLNLMQQQLEGLRQQLGDSLAQNARLQQDQMRLLSDNMQNSTGAVNQRLDNAAKLYGELKNQLGQLSATNTQIQSMVKDVSSLQDILRPPKLRGGMGEVLLENLLREILPPNHFETQFRFRTGTIVDAIIRLKEGIVPVDAKFPLENFRRMLDAKSDDDRKSARKEFARDVKKHIDDIREKYIRTDEGTFPFAMMYIPAENVYYETIIKTEEEGDKALYLYATSKQVVPVSPNSFYAYLLTLAQGFRGMRIEERAREIIDHLNRMRIDLEKFSEDFRKVGNHVQAANTRYQEAEKRLSRFEDKLNSATEQPTLEAGSASLPEAIKSE